MKYRPALLLALGLCLASTAALQAQDPMAALIDQFESSFNAGDYAATAALYTEDAVRYPPGAPPQNGRDAIAADMANYAELTIDIELVGSKMAGDVGSSWGTYALHARSGEGDDPAQNGPWMNVAVKGDDGSWHIYRDIWNLSQQP
jgi:uncharacterized protein (TIGR02246 family)